MIGRGELQTNHVSPGQIAARESVAASTPTPARPVTSSGDGRDREAFISPSRLARFWGVHPNTVYRDIRKGALRAFRMPGGQLRVSIADARRYGRPLD